MFQISCDAMKEQRVPAAEDRVRLVPQVPHEQRVPAAEDRVRLGTEVASSTEVPSLSTMKMGTLKRRAYLLHSYLNAADLSGRKILPTSTKFLKITPSFVTSHRM